MYTLSEHTSIVAKADPNEFQLKCQRAIAWPRQFTLIEKERQAGFTQFALEEAVDAFESHKNVLFVTNNMAQSRNASKRASAIIWENEKPGNQAWFKGIAGNILEFATVSSCETSLLCCSFDIIFIDEIGHMPQATTLKLIASHSFVVAGLSVEEK